MAQTPSTDRVSPPLRGDEASTVLAFLDYHRATFRAKVAGVGADGLALRVGASTMTLGGLMKHLTLVETSWFTRVLLDQPAGDPWDSIDWDADPDWDFRTGADDPAADLFGAYDAAVARSRSHIDAAVGTGGLDTLSAREAKPGSPDGTGRFSLRWIVLHMIEEYARHNGHADLLREAYDGEVGE
ncbi:MAG: hypothetical protein JWP74_1167 [Marmoricola sp.]|nr:hypothetical protein [Marmoricola sp.]